MTMKRIGAWVLCMLLICQAARAVDRINYETGSVFPIAKGEEGPLVETMQRRLIELGFAYGLPDGVYGAHTEEAVKWAKRSLNKTQGNAFTVNGEADEALYRLLIADTFPVANVAYRRGSSGEEVVRLQRRLILLGYMNKVTGTYGQLTADAIREFQVRNGLTSDAVAGPETLDRLYARDALGVEQPAHPLLVYVDTAAQQVLVYRWAGNGFSELARAMACSTGKRGNDTIRGIFQTTEHCGEWYWFNAYQVWAKYAIRILGPYLFHSTLYSSRNDSAAQQSSIRTLGQAVSHGCIRLAKDDMQWLYENTQTGFTTIIY